MGMEGEAVGYDTGALGANVTGFLVGCKVEVLGIHMHMVLAKVLHVPVLIAKMFPEFWSDLPLWPLVPLLTVDQSAQLVLVAAPLVIPDHQGTVFVSITPVVKRDSDRGTVLEVVTK